MITCHYAWLYTSGLLTRVLEVKLRSSKQSKQLSSLPGSTPSHSFVHFCVVDGSQSLSRLGNKHFTMSHTPCHLLQTVIIQIRPTTVTCIHTVFHNQSHDPLLGTPEDLLSGTRVHPLSPGLLGQADPRKGSSSGTIFLLSHSGEEKIPILLFP